MDDKTGIFTPVATGNPPHNEKEDMSEKEALAAIFSGQSSFSKRIPPNSMTKHFDSPGVSNSAPGVFDADKTTVIDTARTGAFNPVFSGRPSNQEEKSEEEDGQPYYIENMTLKKSEKKRKKNLIREQRIRALKAMQSRKTFTHVFGGILLVLFIISASVFISYFIVRVALDFTGITTNEFQVEVEIPENATTEEVAEILQSKGIITMPGFFTFYSNLSGTDGGFLDGLFMLESSMTYGTLINTLQSGDNTMLTAEITIREGMTAEEIGRLLEENFVCFAEDFEQFYTNKQNVFRFERRVIDNVMKFHQLEGYLFPDTYKFFKSDALIDGKEPENMSEREREAHIEYARVAAHKIYNHFNDMITPEMYKTMNEMGLTLDELITIASMVQAEAAFEEDMLLVASVFLNRLNNSSVFPYMQSDPTGYYADNFIKPHITQRNASRYQPVAEAYDTYISPGLPPGAIGNPGLAAINAVLSAPRSDYFYFCANIDTKEVFYATTLVEHEANLAMVAEQMAAGR